MKAFVEILLDGWGMTAAYKDVTALLNSSPGWRRVRAPLVALDNAQMERLCVHIAAFALDQTQDLNSKMLLVKKHIVY